jgi:hypothetical protein
MLRSDLKLRLREYEFHLSDDGYPTFRHALRDRRTNECDNSINACVHAVMRLKSAQPQPTGISWKMIIIRSVLVTASFGFARI